MALAAAPGHLRAFLCQAVPPPYSHQSVGAREFLIVHDPYLAYIGGQFSYAARKKFTPDNGINTV